MWRATLIAASFELAACQSVEVVQKCPPLRQYSLDTQKRLAAELRSLPRETVVGRMVVDYKALRDACRLGG